MNDLLKLKILLITITICYCSENRDNKYNNSTAVRMEIIITIIVTAMIMEDGKLEISAPDKEWLPSI